MRAKVAVFRDTISEAVLGAGMELQPRERKPKASRVSCLIGFALLAVPLDDRGMTGFSAWTDIVSSIWQGAAILSLSIPAKTTWSSCRKRQTADS